jgi:glutathione-regulated potassium-efflux system ancillary protein KefC
MTDIYALAALWLGLALAATLLSIWLRIATSMSEIVVGTVAQLAIGALIGGVTLGTDQSWIKFLASTGAILLTFLAGAELDPGVLRTRWKETMTVGLVAFFAPFLGCAAAAFWLLRWSVDASWLAGIALSTTSVAVVYAVMLEFGLNKTDYGKTVLAACFINDLATVIALGLMFSLAAWADSEAVLPAYVMGMVLAGTVGKDHALVRRLRTVTFGLLTPFYFIRAGSFVSVPALVVAPLAFCFLLGAKMLTKFFGVFPLTRAFRSPVREGLYTTLLMSTGLTFGSISALFGLSHGIVTQAQYSLLIAAVIGSAVVPTLIANAFFLPHHLISLPDATPAETPKGTMAAGASSARASETKP